jgi:3D (Asp-Asp-Asp) domain-containing protein
MRFRKAISACAVTLGILFAAHTGTAAAATFDTTNSIVDYMKSVGEDSSFANRKQVALKYNIVPYTGSMEQNLQLLGILRGTPAEPKQESIAPQAQPQPQQTSKTLTVTATAYTAYCTGCSGVTTTGLNLIANPSQKVIAVDPSVIPLGSKVYVPGYGEAIAADTGGAIKGNRIDVFIPNYTQAMDFGMKTIQITIEN